MQLRRYLIELDEALAARDRAEAEQATTMGALRSADNLRRLSALMAFCSTCQFMMTIPADPAAIRILTDGVGELMNEKHWPKEDVFAVQLALQEAVANAIRHGCRGDVSKHVQCSVSCDESGEVVVVVRDPGPGFDPGAIADPLDAANILKPSGRGIFLINDARQPDYRSGFRIHRRRRTHPAPAQPVFEEEKMDDALRRWLHVGPGRKLDRLPIRAFNRCWSPVLMRVSVLRQPSAA